jgi:anthranilate phosphoribosyltransferase
MIEAAMRRAEAGGDLSREAMTEAMDLIMDGRCTEEEIARFLAGLHHKGETVAEVAGAAVALRGKMTLIRTSRTVFVDTCGTGGDQAGTFNISTAAALVAAAAGVAVAKHGNRAATSRSGSADALSALGVNVEADVPIVERCLDELGICFCFAPLLHAAMKHVAAVRKKLGTPTIFNIVGPLVNPAGAPYQLLGVGEPRLRRLLAEAQALLGSRRSLVVHGVDGLDEVTLTGPTEVTEAAGGQVREFQWTPADFGLPTIGLATILVSGPDQSAAIIRQVLGGRRGPARDIVVANAAAALWTVNRHHSSAVCAEQAAEAIDSGAARDLLARLVAVSHGRERN